MAVLNFDYLLTYYMCLIPKQEVIGGIYRSLYRIFYWNNAIVSFAI